MTDITFDFSERVIAITGSANGIGAGAVSSFAATGARVYGLDIDVERGTAVADATGSTFIDCNITSSVAVGAAFEAIGTECGRLDALINNAGGFWEQHTTESISEDEWDRVVDLNLKAVFLCSRAAIPLLRGSSNGRIITIASVAGQSAMFRSSPPYAAAKAGVASLSRVLAFELAEEGITANVIAPSAILTDRILAVRDEAERARTAASIPMRRYGNVDEIAAWMMFLASEDSSFMTGEVLSVNGGRFMS